jgi:hypothetical protein
MTVPVARKPNIEPSLKDHTRIALTLFNTILETANTRVELERSWAVIEQDRSVRERWEARQGQPRNQSYLSFSYNFDLLFMSLNPPISRRGIGLSPEINPIAEIGRKNIVLSVQQCTLRRNLSDSTNSSFSPLPIIHKMASSGGSGGTGGASSSQNSS